jgi:hypothetical protein
MSGWKIVTDEFVTAERLREIIAEMGMLADQSPDWTPPMAVPVDVPADAVIDEAVFEGGWLTLKWHMPEAALGEEP